MPRSEKDSLGREHRLSTGKGQLTLPFILAFALFIGLTFVLVFILGEIGLVKLERSIEVFQTIDDQGTGLVAFLGSRANGIGFMESLGYPFAGGNVEEQVKKVLGEITEGKYNLMVKSGEKSKEIGTPVPPDTEFTEQEVEIPLPGAREGSIKAIMVLKQW